MDWVWLLRVAGGSTALYVASQLTKSLAKDAYLTQIGLRVRVRVAYMGGIWERFGLVYFPIIAFIAAAALLLPPIDGVLSWFKFPFVTFVLGGGYFAGCRLGYRIAVQDIFEVKKRKGMPSDEA